jgi:hypothetical protein
VFIRTIYFTGTSQLSFVAPEDCRLVGIYANAQVVVSATAGLSPSLLFSTVDSVQDVEAAYIGLLMLSSVSNQVEQRSGNLGEFLKDQKIFVYCDLSVVTCSFQLTFEPIQLSIFPE